MVHSDFKDHKIYGEPREFPKSQMINGGQIHSPDVILQTESKSDLLHSEPVDGVEAQGKIVSLETYRRF
jgi:hypothetical protein